MQMGTAGGKKSGLGWTVSTIGRSMTLVSLVAGQGLLGARDSAKLNDHISHTNLKKSIKYHYQV